MKSPTNEATHLILEYLFQKGIYAWRNSVGATQFKGHFYQFGLSGSSDIFAIMPPHCTFVGIEIKTGKDKLRPAQIGFIKNIQAMGGRVFVVNGFEDFKQQFEVIPS